MRIMLKVWKEQWNNIEKINHDQIFKVQEPIFLN
jgi:hypothetical protein